uniref:Lipase maturation factor n=1 Tax=Amblyomma maculatum TaxID=34609 RepID=G3MRT6_AMBMU
MARLRKNSEQAPLGKATSGCDKRDVPTDSRDLHSAERREECFRKAHLQVHNAATTRALLKNQYWLTRIVFLRSLGFVYAAAFLVALNQNTYLLGEYGLLPASNYLERITDMNKGLHIETVLRVPTLMWLYKYISVDTLLDCIASVGTVLAVGIAATGAANAVSLFLLWILYHSLVNIGQLWYSFGWESQLLETGFLAIFFCPILTWKQLPTETPPSSVVVWGYRWLLFRIMLGAGLIKVRGDKCWWELTCMMYHYETQPVPNPLSYYLHQTPPFVHMLEVVGNHIIELIVPWFMFLTRPFRISCGIIQISFQIILILSGNLSFLNWLTILPSIPYFDDAALMWMFSKRTSNQVALLAKDAKEGKLQPSKPRKATNMALALCLGFLSIPVVGNLFSPHQQMNTSFEPLRLVNTYGAFGSITKRRAEVVIQGTHSGDPHNRSAVWEEYEFFCKPGNVSRRPCVISPYHYRLDWLMWFAAFQDYQNHPWLFHFVSKLLVNDKNVSKIISKNPFMDREPPRFIRAVRYRYRYAPIGSPEAKAGQWWIRSRMGSYMYPVSLSSLKPLLKNFGWKIHAL